jgi:ribose/xylose/arabinose/galactoside ABC-type transport system permease subunit
MKHHERTTTVKESLALREKQRPPTTTRPWERYVSGSSAPALAVAALLVLVIVFELLTEPNFSSSSNITNLLRTSAVPLLLAVGMTVVILTGGIDLSVGGILSVCGIAYAKMVIAGVAPTAALFLTVLLGGALGFVINGILIGRFKLSFFVVTLGSASVLSGAALLWSDNRQFDMSGDALSRALGNDAIGDLLPYGAIVALAALVLVAVVLKYTVFGRSVYAIGGNPEAAELSGVRAEWVIPAVYGVSGLCAGLAGVMLIGRQTIADPTAGNNSLVLYAIAATLLAGVSITGGAGSVYGALVGTAFLQVLSNALALRGYNSAWQMVATGTILLVAVYFDRVRLRLVARRL